MPIRREYISVQGVLRSDREIQSAAGAFVENLWAVIEGNEFTPAYSIGSCVMVRLEGRLTALSSVHQIRKKVGTSVEDFQHVGLHHAPSRSLVSSSGYVSLGPLAGGGQTDLDDIIALDFSGAAKRHAGLGGETFTLDSPHCAAAVVGQFGFVAGYPTPDAAHLEGGETHINLLKRNFSGRFRGTSQHDRNVGWFFAEGARGVDPDGMSGGGVFFIEPAEPSPALKFGGIVVRAGGGHFRFVHAAAILRRLRQP